MSELEVLYTIRRTDDGFIAFDHRMGHDVGESNHFDALLKPLLTRARLAKVPEGHQRAIALTPPSRYPLGTEMPPEIKTGEVVLCEAPLD